MDRDTVIRLLIQAGFAEGSQDDEPWLKAQEDFAALVAAAEREEVRRLYRENQFLKHDLYDCAKACEQIAAAEREQCAKEAELCIKTEPKVSIRAANAIAAAIRSRT